MYAHTHSLTHSLTHMATTHLCSMHGFGLGERGSFETPSEVAQLALIINRDKPTATPMHGLQRHSAEMTGCKGCNHPQILSAASNALEEKGKRGGGVQSNNSYKSCFLLTMLFKPLIVYSPHLMRFLW